MNYTLVYEYYFLAITSISVGLVMMNSFIKKKGSRLRCFLFIAIPKLIQQFSQYYMANSETSGFLSVILGASTLFFDFALFFVVFDGTFQEVIVTILTCDIVSIPMILFESFVKKKFTPEGSTGIVISETRDLLFAIVGYTFFVALAMFLVRIIGMGLRKINYKTKIFNIFGIVGMLFFMILELTIVAGDITKALSDGTIFRYFIMLAAWVAFFITMYMINDYFTKKKLRREIAVLNEEKSRQFEYYNLVKNHNEEIRKIRHDIKGHLTAVSTLIAEKEYDRVEEYISTLDENFSKIKRVNFTGNITADTVICDMAEKCSSQNIKFTPKGLLPEKAGVDDVSLTCILTNILNNAYEACVRQDENSEKFINLDVHTAGGCVIMKCVNSKNQKERVNTQNIKTHKKEPGHGYGMRILNDIVKEYDGTMEIEDKTDAFEIKILLTCKE